MRASLLFNLLGAVVWAGVLGWVAFYLWAPTSIWVEVSKVFVKDSPTINAPQVFLDWKIHRPFYLHWHVIVRRVDERYGKQFVAYCDVDGEAQVSEERKLPEYMDMDWWMSPTKCAWTPGDYYFETLWTWNDLSVERKLMLTSNVFHIY